MNTRLALPLATATLLALSACGSGDDGGTSTQNAATSQEGGQAQGQQGQGAGQNGAGRMPGANGEVVDLSGSTAQVQAQRDGQATGQTAVTWTADTTFTRQASAALADVKAGACVMVTTDQQDSSAGATEAPTEVTAASVRILSTDGDCSTAMGGMGGGAGGPGAGERPSGAPSDMPTDRPSGMPSGGPGGRGGMGGFGTVGEVTKVSGGGFTVSSTAPGGSDAARTVSVTVGSATTYSRTVEAAASAVKVGVCVSARGEADDTGTVAATSIAISQKQDGQCGPGF